MGERPRMLEITNGEPAPPIFSEAEMGRRLAAIRQRMEGDGLDAVLFTSYHNICYYSGYLPCRFGRPYGLLVDADKSVLLAPAIDAGQPRRRAVCDAVVSYTDWQGDNFLRALAGLLPRTPRLGIEEDVVDLAFLRALEEALPGMRRSDVGEASMRLRMIKSAEEIAHIGKMCAVADIAGRACVEAIADGVPEYEVAMAGLAAMNRAIAAVWPAVELRDSWVWLQSGINTDGAHNPLTTRRVHAGDIISLNCFPMVGGYYTALERTLFCGEPSAAHRRYWEINCRVFETGKALIRPGVRCCDIAQTLNALYAEHDLLRFRTFGYGHSFGILCHYYGREAALELREDVETVLEPGMVVSMEPMISIPESMPGAGGYREHDVLVVTEDGHVTLTNFPVGPEENVIRV